MAHLHECEYTYVSWYCMAYYQVPSPIQNICNKNRQETICNVNKSHIEIVSIIHNQSNDLVSKVY